jgi:hypothetical protein
MTGLYSMAIIDKMPSLNTFHFTLTLNTLASRFQNLIITSIRNSIQPPDTQAVIDTPPIGANLPYVKTKTPGGGSMKKEIQKDRLKVFITGARLLSEAEIAGLPEKKLRSVSGQNGLWIEVGCPEGSCSLERDKITLPAGGVVPEEAKGIWLSLFCPEDQCMIEQSSDLP